jgi:heme-degrading monooxygenase HmoA
MAVVEIVRLHPAHGVSDHQFLTASERFEQDYLKKRSGFQKRTLLRGEGSEWAVLVEWETAEDARVSTDAFPNDPASAPFNAVLDPATFEMKSFRVAKVFTP